MQQLIRRSDSRIVKFLSFFTTLDAVFYAQIYDYNPFSVIILLLRFIF